MRPRLSLSDKVDININNSSLQETNQKMEEGPGSTPVAEPEMKPEVAEQQPEPTGEAPAAAAAPEEPSTSEMEKLSVETNEQSQPDEPKDDPSTPVTKETAASLLYENSELMHIYIVWLQVIFWSVCYSCRIFTRR